MHSFVAVFREPIPSDTLEKAGQWPFEDAFLLADNAMVVLSDFGDPEPIRERLLSTEDEDAPYHTAVIFRLNGSYSGFFDPDLWKWLKKARAQVGS